MKSDCCNACTEMRWNDCCGDQERLVCEKCGREQRPPALQAPKVCETNIGSSSEGLQEQPAELPKLTPAQVKAVRWPSEQWDLSVVGSSNREYLGAFRTFCDSLIRYALEDLMPGGEK